MIRFLIDVLRFTGIALIVVFGEISVFVVGGILNFFGGKK